MAVRNIIHTSNPIRVHEFAWTIENVSLVPEVLKGPTVPPFPGYPGKLRLKLKSDFIYKSGKYHYTLKVLLREHWKDGPMTDHKIAVSSSIALQNKMGTILKEVTTSRTKLNVVMTLLTCDDLVPPSPSKLRYSRIKELQDDGLVVTGTLTFSGYGLATSVFPPLKDTYGGDGEVSKDFKTMYESGLSSDITFSVGEDILRAHKTVLVSRSPVFAKMFENDMSESNSNNVVIEDADLHVFDCFLKFLYSGIVEDKEFDTVHSMYYLAQKYQVNGLRENCARILGTSLAIDSVCRSIAVFDLHGDQELKDVAKGFIRHNLFQIAGTEEWAELITTKPQLVKEVLA